MQFYEHVLLCVSPKDFAWNSFTIHNMLITWNLLLLPLFLIRKADVGWFLKGILLL